MPSQSIDSQILKYLPLLERDQKKSVLSTIKAFLKTKNSAPSPQNIEDYNKDLEKAMARMDAGEFYTIVEVEEMAKKWF